MSLSTTLQTFEDSFSTFVGILPNSPAFFELRLKLYFCISDSLISLNLNPDSSDTFSLII